MPQHWPLGHWLLNCRASPCVVLASCASLTLESNIAWRPIHVESNGQANVFHSLERPRFCAVFLLPEDIRATAVHLFWDGEGPLNINRGHLAGPCSSSVRACCRLRVWEACVSGGVWAPGGRQGAWRGPGAASVLITRCAHHRRHHPLVNAEKRWEAQSAPCPWSSACFWHEALHISSRDVDHGFLFWAPVPAALLPAMTFSHLRQVSASPSVKWDGNHAGLRGCGEDLVWLGVRGASPQPGCWLALVECWVCVHGCRSEGYCQRKCPVPALWLSSQRMPPGGCPALCAVTLPPAVGSCRALAALFQASGRCHQVAHTGFLAEWVAEPLLLTFSFSVNIFYYR